MLGSWFDSGLLLLEGFRTTCLLSISGCILVALTGLLVALCRTGILFPDYRIVQKLAIFWIELFRNTPLLCQVLFFYYCFEFSGFYAVLAGLTTYTSAYLAEILRSGFQTVPQAELQSAQLLGLNKFQIISQVLLPRSLESVISPVGNQFVNLIKNTAIAYFVAVHDLTFTFEILTSQTYQFIPFFLMTLLGYYALCMLTTSAINKMERYLLRRHLQYQSPQSSCVIKRKITQNKGLALPCS